MQFYASPEQIMRDRSEYARKGIARGRSVVVFTYAGGVLFVAENTSKALHKVSEIYDRIGFAAVGKYNEFENLRQAGVRMADLRGYSYDRRDVTGRGLANVYAQTLGAIFTEQSKPFEVEICIAEVGETPAQDELYRLTYDGSVGDEPGFVAMGGQSEAIITALRAGHRDTMSLAEGLRLAVSALGSIGGENGKPRPLTAAQLEVAVLERDRPGRAFRRIVGAALERLLAEPQTTKAGATDAGATQAGATETAQLPDEPGDAAGETPSGPKAKPNKNTTAKAEPEGGTPEGDASK
jgi:proteasome alpha subunit